jgi:hypothetical protein
MTKEELINVMQIIELYKEAGFEKEEIPCQSSKFVIYGGFYDSNKS